jgi:hypothetical protein
MELADRDLRCIFCRAILECLIQDDADLREQGFKHDLRFCDRCKSRPESGASSTPVHPTAS